LTNAYEELREKYDTLVATTTSASTASDTPLRKTLPEKGEAPSALWSKLDWNTFYDPRLRSMAAQAVISAFDLEYPAANKTTYAVRLFTLREKDKSKNPSLQLYLTTGAKLDFSFSATSSPIPGCAENEFAFACGIHNMLLTAHTDGAAWTCYDCQVRVFSNMRCSTHSPHHELILCSHLIPIV